MPRGVKSASLSPRSKRKGSAFSSEVDPVRFKKTRQNKESGAPFRFNRNGSSSSAPGRRLVAGFSEALAHARDEIELPSYTVTVPDRVDVAKLRHRLGLSQSGFARAFGLDVTAIHAWEQGRRRPDRTARILLAIIANEPAAVRRALDGRSTAG